MKRRTFLKVLSVGAIGVLIPKKALAILQTDELYVKRTEFGE